MVAVTVVLMNREIAVVVELAVVLVFGVIMAVVRIAVVDEVVVVNVSLVQRWSRQMWL